tara:strand:+ start:1859 stop:2362 length:504 start_codon:yes stop_codon:yes gene_type:complete
MSLLDNQQKLDLQNMIKANETEDVTEHIRKSKQSNLIRDDIKQLLFLKQKYTRLSKSNPGEFDKICVSQCQFLFNNYTDIFNKIKTDTLNLTIMDKFLNILKQIEDGELNQHEGSYLVGQHLKELYVDSALRNQQKMEANERKKKVPKKPVIAEKNISYKDFKKMNP